jgi:hypothetical protein
MKSLQVCFCVCERILLVLPNLNHVETTKTQKLHTLKYSTGQTFTGMRIIFLGTSSARPTLYRNVSSLLLQLPGENWLFDCGEGTQQQMLKLGYGPSLRIRRIFITHLHGDHISFHNCFSIIMTFSCEISRSVPLLHFVFTFMDFRECYVE